MAKKKSSSKKRKKGLVITLTPLSSLLWTIGLVFVLAWVFVFGFFVGRGFLPGKVTAFSDMKVRVKRIHRMLSRHDNSNDTSKAKEEENPKLMFYERLSIKKNEVKKQWQESPEDNGSSHHVVRLRKKLPRPQKQSKGIDPTPNQGNEKTKELSSRSDHYFTIQLASLTEVNKAEELVDRLNRKGYSVYYYEVDVDGRTYYRIRYGRFISRAEAEKNAQILAHNEGIHGFVATLD
jgi:hypothetical protein